MVYDFETKELRELHLKEKFNSKSGFLTWADGHLIYHDGLGVFVNSVFAMEAEVCEVAWHRETGLVNINGLQWMTDRKVWQFKSLVFQGDDLANGLPAIVRY